KFQQRGKEAAGRAQALWQEAEGWLAERGVDINEVLAHKPPTITTETLGDSLLVMQTSLATSRELFTNMKNLILPKLLPWPIAATTLVVLVVLCLAPALIRQPPDVSRGVLLIAGVFGGSALFVLLRAAVKLIGHRQMRNHGKRLAASLDKTE